MSRNFELLAQLNAGFNKQSKRDLPFTVGPSGKPEAIVDGDGAFKEQMLRLVQRVFLSAGRGAPRQLAVCGVDGGNGSTSVCAGAARALAAIVSKSVCLVDVDTRSPGLSSALGLSGTSSIFQDRSALREGCVQVENNLWFGDIDAAAGTGFPADKDELKDRLARLRNHFDFVLIDVPRSSLLEDAAHVIRLAGATVLVIDANRTRRETARRAMELLETSSGVTVLGTVLYGRTFPIPNWIYKRL